MLPSNADVERAVLGSLLINPETHIYIPDLSTEDFIETGHHFIFTAINSIYNDGQEPDAILTSQALGKNLEKAGGRVYLLALSDYACMPSTIQHYIKILKNTTHRRKIYQASQVALSKCQEDIDPNDIVAELTQSVMMQTDADFSTSLDTVSEDVIAEILQGGSSKFSVPFGIPQLDEVTGGMAAGEKAIIAGRPQMGKSAVAFKTAIELAKIGKKVSYVSLEMSKKQLYYRAIAMACMIPLDALRLGKLDEIEKADVKRIRPKLDKILSRLHVIYTPELTASKLRQLAKIQKSRNGLDLLIIDHVGRLRPPKRGADEYATISDAAGIMKNMALDLDIAVLALYQLNRECEKRANKRPIMADLRGSGRIEEEADTIILMYRDKYYDSNSMKDTVELNITKQRQGGTGTIEVPYWQVLSVGIKSD